LVATVLASGVEGFEINALGLEVDRRVLREKLSERAARIGRVLERRDKPTDLAERLRIERALETRGYLRQQVGRWC